MRPLTWAVPAAVITVDGHCLRRRPSTTPLAALILALVLLAGDTPARADRVEDLARTLDEDRDEKARIAAAVALGRIGDARAVPALIRALADKSAVVRGVAASALGHIGDPRAIPALERAVGDESDVVKKRARDALAEIREKQARVVGAAERDRDADHVTPKEPPRMDGGRAGAAASLYVVVKSTRNRAAGGKVLAKKLKEYLIAELQGSPEVTLDATRATEHKLKQFVIDGEITQLKRSTTGPWVELFCEVRITVSNGDGRMLSIVTGTATLQIPKGEYDAKLEGMLRLQALENAVRGAHQNLIGYMARAS